MKKKGVTLIELIVVIAILSVVLGMIYNSFISSNKIYKRGSNEFDLQSSSRSVFLTVGEDIKKAGYVTVNKVTLPTSTSISVVNSGLATITLSNINNIVSSPFRAIYVELSTGKSYVYVVKNINGKKELHKIDCSSNTSSVVSTNFEDVIFTENGNLFVIDFSAKDENGTIRKYSTSVSIRNRK